VIPAPWTGRGWWSTSNRRAVTSDGLAAFYPEQYRFLPQERSLLMAYAGHAAAALETAAALDESRDRNTTLSALLAGKGPGRGTQPGRIGPAPGRALPEIVRCDQADVLLWDAGDARLARAASTVLTEVDSTPAPTKAVRDAGLANRLLEIATPTTGLDTSSTSCARSCR